MDDQTKFLLERIDKLDEKWTQRFEEFLLFKGKLLGMALLAGGVGSALMKIIFKG